MTRASLFTGLAVLLFLPALQAADFEADFLDRTMRLDFFHTGGQGVEIISLDQVISDGPWPGSRTRLVDDTNLGKYLFSVHDSASEELLYSRGFASIFGEWVTTSEASSTHRTFHESLRFPWPRRPVRVVLEQRDARNEFEALWSTEIDPDSRFVNPADRAPTARVWPVLESGPPQDKVDLVLVADGFTAEEMPRFHNDARRLVEALFRWEPFKSRRSDFNVWAVDVVSAESGVSRPRAGEFRRNPIGTSFNAFDSERYVLTYDNRAMRDAAAAAPYEYLEVLVNEEQYGGGGIFANFATASTGAGFAEYLFVHEFGHHFAGLGDEYYTSPVSYATGATDLPEPWEPNVTALHDPENLKWADLAEETTPLPTPWSKQAYDSQSRAFQARRAELRSQGVSEEVMDEYFREVRDWSTEFLGAEEHAHAVGAFEGASYEATGLYRPQADCIMFTRDEVGFCAVCRQAIERVIDLYSR